MDYNSAEEVVEVQLGLRGRFFDGLTAKALKVGTAGEKPERHGRGYDTRGPHGVQVITGKAKASVNVLPPPPPPIAPTPKVIPARSLLMAVPDIKHAGPPPPKTTALAPPKSPPAKASSSRRSRSPTLRTKQSSMPKGVWCGVGAPCKHPPRAGPLVAGTE